MREETAVTAADLLRYRLPAMKRRVGSAFDVIEAASVRGRLGVAFSGGKDSTALLSLARTLDVETAAGFYDSGLEYPETAAFVQATPGVDRIRPQKSLPEMLRAGGYWGYNGPDRDPASTGFDFRAFLVNEPSRQFIVRRRLAVVGIGLRAGESAGRLRLRRARGRLHAVPAQDCWHCYPLMDWSQEDVWAYIAGRGLPYNPIYDRMAQAGIPRAEWRVSTLLGESGANLGRIVRLKQISPGLFNELAAEFPQVRCYC